MRHMYVEAGMLYVLYIYPSNSKLEHCALTTQYNTCVYTKLRVGQLLLFSDNLASMLSYPFVSLSLFLEAVYTVHTQICCLSKREVEQK